MEGYSKKLLEHFLHPRNIGEINTPDGTGFVGDPSCGDFLIVTIKINNDRITDIKFKCKGCPAAIGTASAMTEMALGRSLDEITTITPQVIEEAVGGLPKEKQHCSNLGAAALENAICDFIAKKNEQEEFIRLGTNIFTN